MTLIFIWLEIFVENRKKCRKLDFFGEFMKNLFKPSKELKKQRHSFKGCNMYLLEEIHEIVILGPEMRENARLVSSVSKRLATLLHYFATKNCNRRKNHHLPRP